MWGSCYPTPSSRPPTPSLSGGSLATGLVLGRQPAGGSRASWWCQPILAPAPGPWGLCHPLPQLPLAGVPQPRCLQWVPAHTQLAPLVPPDGDSSPSCYLRGDPGPYLPESPLPSSPPQEAWGCEQPSGMWERAQHPGVCRARFESQVLCSPCPVTLGKMLIPPRPWDPRPGNWHRNRAHPGGQGFSEGGSFCPVFRTWCLCFLSDLDKAQSVPKPQFLLWNTRQCRPHGSGNPM